MTKADRATRLSFLAKIPFTACAGLSCAVNATMAQHYPTKPLQPFGLVDPATYLPDGSSSSSGTPGGSLSRCSTAPRANGLMGMAEIMFAPAGGHRIGIA